MDYRRVDFIDGDFLLVFEPVEAIAHKVRAYHLELLNIVRSADNYWMPEADQVFYEKLGLYYVKISDLLGFDCSLLKHQSRHNFFIASQERGEKIWISELELLMGYDFSLDTKPKDKVEEIQITSGEPSVDLLAEMFLHLEGKQVDWLINHYPSKFLVKFTKQISDRRRGKELIEEKQKQKDREFVVKSDASKKLKKQGFSIPEF